MYGAPLLLCDESDGVCVLYRQDVRIHEIRMIVFSACVKCPCPVASPFPYLFGVIRCFTRDEVLQRVIERQIMFAILSVFYS